MKRTTYQVPELRDENDNIIQQGAFGKNTALANSTNDGWIDYVANDLEALRDNINGSRIYVKNKDALTTPGDISAMYIAEDTGKWYLWDGNKYIETDNARKIADEALAARDAAKASQSAAKTSEQNAKTSESNAAASESAAKTSEQNAKTSESNAEASKTAAATSATAAAGSAGAAKTSETNAASSKTAAATSATNAANSAKAAAASATAAANSATNAANSAKAAAASESAAATSASAAKTSEQNAKTSESNAEASKTAAATSATAAAGSAGAAKTSETNAASSKTAAATSATNAANSAKAAAASATAAANSARVNQAAWNQTDDTQTDFIKNKPLNLKNIGNEGGINLYSFFKDDNNGNPVYTLMQELANYSPNTNTLPVPASAGFNGIVYGKLRSGNGYNQLVALVTVNLGYEYDFLYSSSYHYRPVVVKDEASNKYYWAMMACGSHQDVIMFGQFTKAPLFTKIMATDKQGTMPSGWSLIHDAKTYQLPNTIVGQAICDRTGALIDATYLKKTDAQLSIATNTLTATDATFTGQTTVPTANAGNSSKAIANTEFVAKSIASLVNGAPDQLNTLNELAKALGNDSNFSATVTAELAKKLNSTEAESTYATKKEAGVPYQIKRNTAYEVGDVLTSPSLPPGCVIVVTQAGTTGSIEPDWATIKSNMTPITDGTVKFVVTKSGGVLPGTVTAFSGSFKDGYPVNKNTGLVDKEWHLCDGTNGTPDLRSRFIYGGDGTNNGATGGETEHKLTEAELPALSGSLKHIVVWNNDFSASGILRNSAKWKTRFNSSANENNHDAIINVNFGGNQPHNNMPPYYTLAYIMKL